MKVCLKIFSDADPEQLIEVEEKRTIVFGRSSSADVARPMDPTMSRKHCQLEVEPPRVYLRDLKSTNGTYLNDQRTQGALLRNHDLVRCGKVKIRVEIEGLPEGAGLNRAVCTVCGMLISEEEFTINLSADAVFICPKCRMELQTKPQPIQGYQILRELGRGGMGVVYLARSEATDTIVVIKVVIPEQVGDLTVLQMFQREARVLQSLDHPHIVSCVDQGVCDNLHYFVMKFIDGRDAARVVNEQGGRMIVKDALTIVTQCLDALDYAHGKKLVHRDLKPANILVSGPSGEYHARILDFGLAKNYEQAGNLTATGQMRGTVTFMPPEQAMNAKHVGPTADIYAMGAVLYYMISGHLMFKFEDNGDHLKTIMQDPLIPIQQHGVDIPPALADTIHKSLERHPDDRFQTAAEMKQSLLNAQG
ncbi:protein kinase [Candidatus Sumerlaeota bacterium]|nr:protein kinase [Candidatus Sumerlaeota bacterium]